MFVPPAFFVVSPHPKAPAPPPAVVRAVTVSDEDVREVKAPVARTAPPVRAVAVPKNILGFMAYARGKVPIRRSASSRSRRVYTLSNRQTVVAVPYNDDWTKVRMNNGRAYFVAREALELTAFAVTAGPSPSRTTLTSRGLPGRPRGSREALVNYSYNFIGTPYVWGGNDMRRGIDCSGFVKKLYGAIGLSLPRTAAEQARVGIPINRLEDLKAGDRLYFWEAKRGKIGHTGMYTGNGYFVHSSTGHGGVQTDYLTARWLRILVAARR